MVVLRKKRNSMFRKRSLSLKKSLHIFFLHLKLFRKKQSTLSPALRQSLKQQFELLQEALLEKNKEKASLYAQQLQAQAKEPLKKTFFEKLQHDVVRLCIALVIAIIIRQMWFEFYEIPTGSMRPTLKEKDRLVVSKTQFTINIPLTTRHFYFDPSAVERGGIVVFTGANMDIQDVDTTYFYLFPGKKQYIKRLIGKPGDTLYFYGGKIYGVDQDHKDISSSFQQKLLEKIDHVPFIYFEGRAITPRVPQNRVCPTTLIYQMNQLIAKLQLMSGNKVEGVLETSSSSSFDPSIKNYEDLWGFKHYGMARILTEKEYLSSLEGSSYENITPSNYYLEIYHNPSLKTASMKRDLYGRIRPTLGLSRSIIPLDSEHLKKIFDSLYTARFIVDEEGYARRYGYKKSNQLKKFQPQLPSVPAGTYEFYYGQAYQVLWEGITRLLPKTHPIYAFSPEKTYTLFNLGIEFDTRFLANAGLEGLMPSRYTFYKDGALCLMGNPILEKNDPVLENFLQRETAKQLSSKTYLPYFPAKGPFLENGALDIEAILKYGVKIPEKHYLVLGDNYAMSADSRDFGFVPENNLRGVPNFIFWPFGDRFGHPNQSSYPFFTVSRSVVYVLAALSALGYRIYYRKRHKLPVSLEF